MRIHRYLKEDNIDLDFDPFAKPERTGRRRPWEEEEEEEEEVDESELSPHQRFKRKERVLERLVQLLEPSGNVRNVRKCFTDLRNREAKASTAIGRGVAMPHVRTAQAKDFTMGVAVVPEPGIWFDAIDEEPVRIFFPMVAPPHKDRFYLKVERALAQALADEDDTSFIDDLLAAETPGEVIVLLQRLID